MPFGKTSRRCSCVQRFSCTSRAIASTWVRSASRADAGSFTQRSSPSLVLSIRPPSSLQVRCTCRRERLQSISPTWSAVASPHLRPPVKQTSRNAAQRGLRAWHASRSTAASPWRNHSRSVRGRRACLPMKNRRSAAGFTPPGNRSRWPATGRSGSGDTGCPRARPCSSSQPGSSGGWRRSAPATPGPTGHRQ